MTDDRGERLKPIHPRASPRAFAFSFVQVAVCTLVALTVALLISSLTLRLGQSAMFAHDRELRTSTLYAMSRDLASTRGADNLASAAVRHVREAFSGQVAVLRPG